MYKSRKLDLPNPTVQYSLRECRQGAYLSSDFGGFYGTELGGHWELERHESNLGVESLRIQKGHAKTLVIVEAQFLS